MSAPQPPQDLPDGASRLACGRAGTAEAPVAVVGGNCSIQARHLHHPPPGHADTRASISVR